MTPDLAPARWWGPHALPGSGDALCLRLGPFWLTAAASGATCRLVWSTGRDPLGPGRGLSVVGTADALPDGPVDELRVPLGGGAPTLTIRPLLAPRAYVCRPVGSVVIPPGATLEAYVSTPLWLGVGVPEPALDVPTQAPNQTWFGADTVEGELCYSGRTALRTDLAELERRPHRAITPVRLSNRSRAPLTVRRLRVPAPSLPLFISADGQTWTPPVSLSLEGAGDQAQQVLGERPPPETGPVELLAPPRVAPTTNLVSRAVGALLS